jgi:hypothetical protein
MDTPTVAVMDVMAVVWEASGAAAALESALCCEVESQAVHMPCSSSDASTCRGVLPIYTPIANYSLPLVDTACEAWSGMWH